MEQSAEPRSEPEPVRESDEEFDARFRREVLALRALQSGRAGERVTAVISYNIIAGDTLTKVFRLPGVGPGPALAVRHFVISVSTILFTLPLSLFRNISKLGNVSLLSMVLTVLILITVITRTATLGPQIPPTLNAAFTRWNAIRLLVLSFDFSSNIAYVHHNSFMIYGSLEEPSLGLVSLTSVGSSLIVSALFAVTGYATFTGYTQVSKC
ncbi:LOW QUALITY PROTEIN: putative sodium-coupled neutral amino acid transporter 11 [Salvelinus alpinus]